MFRIAMTPPRQIRMAMTQANTGRTMKKLGMAGQFLRAPTGRGWRYGTRYGGRGRVRAQLRRLPRNRLHLAAFMDCLQAGDNHAVAACEAAGHDPVVFGRFAGGDILAYHLAIGPDDQRIGADSVTLQCLLWNQKHLALLAQ